MAGYEERVRIELNKWMLRMSKRPSLSGLAAKKLQSGFNSLIPEKAHIIITEAIKNMVKVILSGSEFIKERKTFFSTLEERENAVFEKVKFYKRTAATSGAWTGAGGILLGLADFPILLSIKIKFLFDVAAIYGFDTSEFKERLYILYIFQLAFTSEVKRRDTYHTILDWERNSSKLPANMESFDWRTFQQEYRDYIDIAKMLQLVPGIGAFIGAYANYKLLDKLAETAINAYRLRLIF